MSSKVKKVWKNEDGYLRAERMTRSILLSVGLWPLQKDYPRFLRNFLVAICVALSLFMMIPLGIFIYSDAPNISVRLQLSAPLLFSALCMSKYANLMWKGPKIESCLRRMAEDWQNVKDPLERSTMLDYARRARSMTKFCMALTFTGGLFYSTVGPLSRAPIVVDNVTLHQLAYPGNFIFFNPRTRPAYDYVFALQSLGSVVRFSSTCGVCSIFIWFVMHISGRIDVLGSTIERAVDQLDNRMLKRIVDDQLNLYRLAKELGDIFNELCLVEFVGNTVLICLVGYYMIIALLQHNYTRAYTLAISLSSMTYNLFILCYYGQILMDKFDELGRSIYMADWHKLSGSNARSIVLLLVRANRPFALTAGKIIVLSMASFAKVIKTSATYFNVLWNITSHSMNAQ
ncbi:odorant receptor 82a-like [Trichogramma pretiosum]|uniref:odorant receptor 82a-like n=1 Tax=Trichogramma pretiosum TaxID=7493 RepID=UPI000C71BFC3|nr:odorant receptor 82a-like [Trichogramma pretiosum]